MVKTTAKTKSGWRSKSQPEKTYVIKYCIPPDYEHVHTIEKTGKYTYVRFIALSCLGSNAVILGIDEKI